MGRKIETPPSPRGTVEQQISQMYNYLFRLASGLNVELDRMGTGSPDTPAADVMGAKDYNELRAMIGNVSKDTVKELEKALNKAAESGEFDGNGIAEVESNADSSLTFEFTDGTSFTTPALKGEKGADGAPGADYILTQADKEEIAAMIPGGGGTTEFPVGFMLITSVAENPSTYLGYGTWEQKKDTFILGAGDTYEAGTTGGAATHTLAENELPEISGTVDFRAWGTGTPYTNSQGAFSSLGETSTTAKNFAAGSTDDGYRRLKYSFGGGQAHNNMPPYLTAYIWERTA